MLRRDGGGETVHVPFRWEEGGKGGSDRDGNSRTITAKDKCIWDTPVSHSGFFLDPRIQSIHMCG